MTPQALTAMEVLIVFPVKFLAKAETESEGK
jgi:hypothetical protein